MPLEWYVAIRFLREGRLQTLLIVAGAAIGVAVMLFLSALMGGLAQSLIAQTLGTQAHIVVRPLAEAARPQRASTRDTVVMERVERSAQRVRSIVGWQQVMADVERAPGVVAVSPVVSGPVFAQRGDASKSVVLLGIDPERFARIYPIRTRLREGAYRPIGDGCVIGTELADDLGVRVGDKVRLTVVDGASDVFTVTGLFDLGNREVNRRWVLVSMRAAQSLLDLVGGVSAIDVTVDDVFAATTIAESLAAQTGLVADSWMQTNAQLMVGLRSQDSSSTLIQVFVVLAVAMGIASVLIVSVVQKGKEIGILRAMGTTRRSVLVVFLLQGGIVGLLGSVVGTALGMALGAFFASLAVAADGSPLFPVNIGVALVARCTLVAVLTGLLSAVLPARRAARLDPAVAIRNG
jgi:lipoprotein-releasing system permease protein